ncbi:hypothetical protein, partial [Burkholderia stabilis]
MPVGGELEYVDAPHQP